MQVGRKELTSKSDVVNDLIRKTRETEAIRAKLIEAEKSEFTRQTRAEIKQEIKEEMRRNGEL